MIRETTPIRTPKGLHYVILTDSQAITQLYGKPISALAPSAEHHVSQAPAYMGYGRPAQNAAGQP